MNEREMAQQGISDYAEVLRLRAERDRLREALITIQLKCGRVCIDYEVCHHVACASSYKAWAIADKALEGSDANKV